MILLQLTAHKTTWMWRYESVYFVKTQIYVESAQQRAKFWDVDPLDSTVVTTPTTHFNIRSIHTVPPTILTINTVKYVVFAMKMACAYWEVETELLHIESLFYLTTLGCYFLSARLFCRAHDRVSGYLRGETAHGRSFLPRLTRCSVVFCSSVQLANCVTWTTPTSVLLFGPNIIIHHCFMFSLFAASFETSCLCINHCAWLKSNFAFVQKVVCYRYIDYWICVN